MRGFRLLTVFPLFWLGLFTTQNALLAPAALLLWAGATAPWRRSAAALAGFAVPLAVLFGALNAAGDDGADGRVIPYATAFMGAVPLGSLLAGVLGGWIGAPSTVLFGGLAGAVGFARTAPDPGWGAAATASPPPSGRPAPPRRST